MALSDADAVMPDTIGNWNLLQSRFLSDLRGTLADTARECEAYRFLCDDQGFSPADDLNTAADLPDIPYVTSATFKRSGNLFARLLRIPTDSVDVFTASSSTSGDPSFVGRRWRDVDAYRVAFQVSFEKAYGHQPFDRTLSLWPSPEWISGMRGEYEGKPVDPFAAHVIPVIGPTADPERRTYLTSPGAGGGRPNVNLDTLIAGLKEAERRGERVLVTGTPPIVYLTLLECFNAGGNSFSLGSNGYVMVGAGGWDGKKGTLDIGQTFTKGDFVRDVTRILGIPSEHISDHYGFSESAVAVPGHYVSDLNDFVYHVPPWGRVIIRDAFTLEPIQEAEEEGLLEMITPYGMSSHAGAAILVDDLVSLVGEQHCPVCGYEGPSIRVHGRAPNSHKAGCGAILL